MIKLNGIILFVLLSLSFILQVNAQSILQDDFQYKSNYWFWRADGNQLPPEVNDGYLNIKLQNAQNNQYCNSEIYDPNEPYFPGTQARVRLKTSDMHNGSRGWGFWDGDLDTASLLFDFDVAWIMQQKSSNPNPDYNWLLFGVDGNKLENRQLIDLNSIVNVSEWNTYKIVWGIDNVSLYINDIFVDQSNIHLPDQAMRMDIWIDNRIINYNNVFEKWENTNVNNSEMFVDFIEISGLNGPSIQRPNQNNIILWDSPNTFPNGEKEKLWKTYNFETYSDGEVLLFVTGSAESYGNIQDSDNLRIVIDNIDFGWNSKNSLIGSELQGRGKSIVLPINLATGNHTLNIYSDITPFLRDVIVVSSESSNVVYSKDFNETAPNVDGLWKTINFNNDTPRNLTFLLSGIAKENSGIRLELNNENFGWQPDKSIDGDILKGLPNTIVINKMLDAGSHSLKIFNRGTPQLYSVAAYGSSLITKVDSKNSNSNEITLMANPVPFNISTNILYKTKKSSHNIVSIVNVIGQKVATLVNEFQPKGEYKLVWNAGKETSGVYFCILEADNYFKIEKLLLLK